MTGVITAVIEYIALVGAMIFPLFTIHCFYDDTVPVTNRKLLIFALLPLFSYIPDIFPQTELPITFGYVIAAPILAVAGGKMTFFKRFINWSRYVLIMILFLVVLVPLTSALAAFSGKSYDELDADVFVGIVAVYSLLPSLAMYLVYIRKDRSMPFRRQDKFLVWLYIIFVFFIIGMDTDADGNHLGVMLVKPDNAKDYLLILFIIFMITFLPFFIIRNCQSSYYGRLSEHQQYFLEAELNASKRYKAAQEETRAFRHDVQNNLTAVAMLMEQKKYDEAEQYINDMRTEVSSFSPKVVTGDEMLDSLISAKLAKIAENRIKFKIDGVIDGGLGWKPMDICTVFANALDNAIEAASQVAEGEPRDIGIIIKKTAHQRLISISNSCKEDIDCKALMDESLHFTSKADKRLHGFGLKNIQKVIEKNGGMMKINCENKRFSLDMILRRN